MCWLLLVIYIYLLNHSHFHCRHGQSHNESPVPELKDPLFAKTSPKLSFSVNINERFGLVFAKTGSINSGTAQAWRMQSVLGGQLPSSSLVFFYLDAYFHIWNPLWIPTSGDCPWGHPPPPVLPSCENYLEVREDNMCSGRPHRGTLHPRESRAGRNIQLPVSVLSPCFFEQAHCLIALKVQFHEIFVLCCKSTVDTMDAPLLRHLIFSWSRLKLSRKRTFINSIKRIISLMLSIYLLYLLVSLSIVIHQWHSLPSPVCINLVKFFPKSWFERFTGGRGIFSKKHVVVANPRGCCKSTRFSKACGFKLWLKLCSLLLFILLAVTSALGVQGGVLPLGQSAVLPALPPLPPAHRPPHWPEPGRHGRHRTGTGPHPPRLPRPGLAQGFWASVHRAWRGKRRLWDRERRL